MYEQGALSALIVEVLDLGAECLSLNPPVDFVVVGPGVVGVAEASGVVVNSCRGVRGEGGRAGWCCQRSVRCCGAGPPGWCYPAGPGRARMADSRLVKVSAHGQRVGMRRVWQPERLTATAGIAVIRVRNVPLVMVG